MIKYQFERPFLQMESQACRREWLLTNGIGGYASSSILGANMRRYHGLLVAALKPPLGRAVLLSKLEETVVVSLDGDSPISAALSTNHYPGAIYPEGFLNLDSWEFDGAQCIWRFGVAGIEIEKRIWMDRAINRVRISYTRLSGPANSSVSMCIAPLVTWRDYHSEMRASDAAPTTDWSRDNQLQTDRLTLTFPWIQNQSTGQVIASVSITDWDGLPIPTVTFKLEPCWYYNIELDIERERGQDFEEDLFSPGTIEFSLSAGETVVITAEAHLPKEPEGGWITPRNSLSASSERATKTSERFQGDDFSAQLARASDAFVVNSITGRKTVIAGYPWFSDWGRDTMIALPGLCLATGRFEDAKDILVSFSHFVDGGMLPNRFPDDRDDPDYNTVDATLWYFVSIYRYWKATGDSETIRKYLYPALADIIQHHQRGTRFGIHVDIDGLLFAGTKSTQLTWMDAKIGDHAITPRCGKAVEINALWQSALRIVAALAEQFGYAEDRDRYLSAAEAHGAAYSKRFVRSDGRGLYDVVDVPDQGDDASVRPNQIFAVSLPFGPFSEGGSEARGIVNTAIQELYTPYGIRTLSYLDPRYCARYAGSMRDRDSSYHQGTAWPWLMGAFAEAHYKVYGDTNETLSLLAPMQSQLSAYGVGSLAEVYDGGSADLTAQSPGGCIAQAWSVAEILRVFSDINAIRRRN